MAYTSASRAFGHSCCGGKEDSLQRFKGPAYPQEGRQKPRTTASGKPSLISGQPGLPSDTLHCHCSCVLLSLPSCSFILQSNCPFPGTYSNTIPEHLFPLSHLLGASGTDNGLPFRLLTMCLGLVRACLVPVTEPRALYIFSRFSTSEPGCAGPSECLTYRVCHHHKRRWRDKPHFIILWMGRLSPAAWVGSAQPQEITSSWNFGTHMLTCGPYVSSTAHGLQRCHLPVYEECDNATSL